MIICFFNFNGLVKLLGATEHTEGYVKDYLLIILMFSIFPMASYYMEVMLKVDGKPKFATLGVCISAVTNLTLDYVFVIVLKYGVKGAAIATVISQCFSFTLFLIHFIRAGNRIEFVKFKFDLNETIRTFKCGIPDFITEISSGITVFTFNRIILSVIGEKGVVVYTVITYVNTLVTMTMIAVSQGMQPLVSYNYGKRDSKSIGEYFKLSIKTVVLLAILAFAISQFFAVPINRVFISLKEAELLKYSVSSFKLYSIVFLFLGFNIVLSGFYTAVEKPKIALIISTARGIMVMLLCLVAMSYMFKDTGIWLSATVSEFVCLIANVVVLLNTVRKIKTKEKVI